MSYLKRHGTRRVPQWAPLPGQDPNSAGGFAWAVDDVDAAAPLPRPRLGGRLVLRVRVDADPRERAGGRARASARTARARSPRSSRVVDGGPRAEERPGALRARAGGRPRRRGDAPGGARGAAAGRPHGHAPVPVRDCSSRASAAGAARCGARSAAGTRRSRSTRSPTRRSSTASATGVTHRDLLRLAHPARRVGAGNPTLDVSDEHARLFEWIVRGGETDGLPRLVEGFVRAQEAATPARGGRARPRVPPAARGAPAGAPDLARGLGGAARRHADDGADPQPGDDDARRRARAGLGRHGEGGRAAGRRGAHPPARVHPIAVLAALRTYAAGRGAPRPRRVEPGARDRGRARRRVLHGVRQRRAGGQAAAARPRRVGLDDVRLRRRRAGPDAARRVGGARAGDGGDRVAVRGRRLLRRQGRLREARPPASGRATPTA